MAEILMCNRPQRVNGPLINTQICNCCGLCVKVCPTSGLSIVQGSLHKLDTVACRYDGSCEAVCPTGAISLSYEIVFEELKK